MPVAKPRYLLCEKLLPRGVFLFAETCFTRLDFVGSELLLEELVDCSFWDVSGISQELPSLVSNSCFTKATELGRGGLERGGVGFC